MTEDWKNKLYFGDNIDVLKDLYKDYPKGFIDLIYIDPPFNSKRNYNLLFEDPSLDDLKAQKEAFADTWSNITYMDALNSIADLNQNLYSFLKTLERISSSTSAISYLTTMTLRIWYMHKLLKDTGSFYLHCDPNMSHYLKIVCDLIFGEKNFRNEISWCYRKWAIQQKQFVRNHDIILFYTKTKINTFNTLYIPVSEGTMKRHKGKRQLHQIIEGKVVHLEKEQTEESKGTPMIDWWDMSIINPASKERLGYPTQKPEALLERIIKASSDEGDIVADFFCGCGTTVAVAERLKRKWLGVDISHLAVKLIANRLIDKYSNKIKENFEIFGFPKDIQSARMLATETKSGRLKFEEWIVEVMLHGVLNENRTQMGYDGYFTFYLQDEKQVGMIEVKSGNATPTQLNHFIKTLESKQGNIGIFVCFKENLTKNMHIIAKKEAYYKEEYFGQQYPKIQLITVEDLIDGKTINIPFSTKTTFKVAPKDINKPKQPRLDF